MNFQMLSPMKIAYQQNCTCLLSVKPSQALGLLLGLSRQTSIASTLALDSLDGLEDKQI